MFKTSAKAITKPRTITAVALLSAMYVVLYSLKVPIAPELRITLTFVPVAAAGYLLGPVGAGLVGILGDLIGFLLFPQGTYFPGFTLSAMLTGVVYGCFLYHAGSRGLRLRAVAASLAVGVFINIGVNTLWLSMLYKKAYFVYLSTRAIKNLIEFPFRIIVTIIVVDILNRTGITKKYL